MCVHPVIQRPGNTSQQLHGLVYKLPGHTYLEEESTQIDLFEHQPHIEPEASFLDCEHEFIEESVAHESAAMTPE